MTGANDTEWTGAAKRTPTPPPHLALARAARAHSRPAIHDLRVAEVAPLTTDAVAITFEVPAELRDAYRFSAGQHLTVLWNQDGTEVRRSFSLCVPAGVEQPTIAVKRLEGGAFSTYATESLHVGDRLRVMTPTGTFVVTPRAEHATTYVAIAAGSGITPILSMIETLIDAEPLSRVLLLYQNHAPESTMFHDRLSQLAADNPGRLSVQHRWSQHYEGLKRVGRLDRIGVDAFLDQVDSQCCLTNVDRWLMCGPSELMDTVVEALEDRNVAQDRIRREIFFDRRAGDPDLDGELPLISCNVSVRIGDEQLQFSLSSQGESVLAAAARINADIPYSCQEGVCATCRAKVLAGRAVMTRCSGLDRREQEAGYILTCQAHPVTEILSVDFDL